MSDKITYESPRSNLTFPKQNKQMFTDATILAQRKGLTLPAYIRSLLSEKIDEAREKGFLPKEKLRS